MTRSKIKIKTFFVKIPRILAENAFLTFLGLFLIALLFSGAVFYKYNILVKKADIKTADQPVGFRKDIHDQALQAWQEREKIFLKIDSQNHLNPFKF